MSVVDIFTYNGERQILKLHLGVLDPFVDKFIIVEAKTTFSGKKKPLYFSEQEHLVKKYWKKIRYYIVNENYSQEEIDRAFQSPNTVGATHWKREFLQKEAILSALKYYNTQPEDTVYIGDVDEIWQPYTGTLPAKLKMRVYAYHLDNLSNELFWGTYVSKYGDLEGKTLNHERARTDIRTEDYAGWHFTSMGGVDEVRRKLNDSYTPESYNTPEVQNNLLPRLTTGQDYLGRPFKFHKDQKNWPSFLRKKRYKFASLLLGNGNDLQANSQNFTSPKATNL